MSLQTASAETIYLGMESKSFRKFVEESDKKASSPYLDALEDELGINPDDLDKESLVGSFFSMGGEVRNIGTYRVVSLKRDDSGKVTHGVVERYDDRAIKNRRYRDEDGKMIRMKSGDAKERLVIPIDELDKLMSQSFQPPPQAPGGAM